MYIIKISNLFQKIWMVRLYKWFNKAENYSYIIEAMLLYSVCVNHIIGKSLKYIVSNREFFHHDKINGDYGRVYQLFF